MKTQEFINIMKTKGKFEFGDYKFYASQYEPSETVKEIYCNTNTGSWRVFMGYLLESCDKIWFSDFDNEKAITIYEQVLEDVSSYVETDIFIIFTDMLKKVLKIKKWNANICNEQIIINDYYSEREPLIVYNIRVANAGFNNYIINHWRWNYNRILELINDVIIIKDGCEDSYIIKRLICLIVQHLNLKDLYDDYKYIYDSVFKIKSNYSYWIHKELIRVCKSKKDMDIDYMEFFNKTCTLHGSIRNSEYSCNLILPRSIEVDSDEILKVKYRNKEIYDRQEAIQRLCSSDFQAGIKELANYIKQEYKLSTYNKDFYDSLSSDSKVNYMISDAICGDLVFVHTHFGLILGEEKVFLDNGKIEKLKDVFIHIKEKELKSDLLKIKNNLAKKYQKSNMTKFQEANKAKKTKKA